MPVTQEMYPEDRAYVERILGNSSMTAKKIALMAARDGDVTTTGQFLTHAPKDDAFTTPEQAQVLGNAYANEALKFIKLSLGQPEHIRSELLIDAAKATQTAGDITELAELAGEVDLDKIFKNLE